MMARRHRRDRLALLAALALLACSNDGGPPAPSPGVAGNHLVVDGRPSAVLVEIIGPGVEGFTGGAEYTRTLRRGDTLAVLLIGTDLEGSMGLVDLGERASLGLISVRVVEAADRADQLMQQGQVTARIHVGRWPPAP